MAVLHSRLGRAAFPVMRELNDAADPSMLARDAVRAMRAPGGARSVLPRRLLLDGALPLRRPLPLLPPLHRSRVPRPLQVRQARRPRARGAARRARRGAGACAIRRRGRVHRRRGAVGARRREPRRPLRQHGRRRHRRPRRDALRQRPRRRPRRSPLRRRGHARAPGDRRPAPPRASSRARHRPRRRSRALALRARGRRAAAGPRRHLRGPRARRAAAVAATRIRRERALVHRGRSRAFQPTFACPTRTSRASPRSTPRTATRWCCRPRCAR